MQFAHLERTNERTNVNRGRGQRGCGRDVGDLFISNGGLKRDRNEGGREGGRDADAADAITDEDINISSRLIGMPRRKEGRMKCMLSEAVPRLTRGLAPSRFLLWCEVGSVYADSV